MSAAQRIIESAAALLAREGPSRPSMQDLAEAAEVSKGLLHYHFTDRDALLARVADWVTAECTAREREATTELEAASALDAVWVWLTEELALGQRRLLLQLAADAGPALREALARSAAARRAQGTATMRAVFVALGLRPRVGVGALGALFAALCDGVAAGAVDPVPGSEVRAALDAFWLAMLGLGEEA